MRCPNEVCWKPLINIRATTQPKGTAGSVDEFIALPRWPSEWPVSEDVEEPFRTDFLEAAAILERSANASAALARRIIADVLRAHGYDQFRLDSQIKAFVEDPAAPTFLKNDLHYLREIGDFGAHTQHSKADGEIIPVSREEAEWSIEVVDRMFQHYFVAPAEAERRRQSMDEKLQKAGRTPIAPMPPAPTPED